MIPVPSPSNDARGYEPVSCDPQQGNFLLRPIMLRRSMKRESEDSMPGPTASSPAQGNKRRRVDVTTEDGMSREDHIAIEKEYFARTRHRVLSSLPAQGEEPWRHLIFPTATFRNSTKSLDRHKKAWNLLLRVITTYRDEGASIDDLTELIPGTSEAASLARVMCTNLDLIRIGCPLRINTGNRLITSHEQSLAAERLSLNLPAVRITPSKGYTTRALSIKLVIRHCRTYIPRMINEAIERIFETCRNTNAHSELTSVILKHKVRFDKILQHIQNLVLNGPFNCHRERGPSLPSPFNRFAHDFFEAIVTTLQEIAQDKDPRAIILALVKNYVRQWEQRYDPLDGDTEVWGFMRTNVAALAAFARWAGVDLPLPDEEYDLNSLVDALPEQATNNPLLDKVRQIAVTFQDREGTLGSMSFRDLRDARAQIASQFDTLVVLIKADMPRVDDLALVGEILAIMDDCGITEFVEDIRSTYQRMRVTAPLEG